ncbi:MAG: beta-ketoacyl-ACP synthase III [Rickettsiales bacterium]
MMFSKIISVGSFLPKRELLNKDLPAELETSDEWISTRTGIKKRYVVDGHQQTSDLALQALVNSGFDLAQLEGLIIATSTPDQAMPSTASIVQGKLALKLQVAFDINVACAGFVNALAVADGLIKSKTVKNIAVVGAETMTRTVDWSDRSTCVLFGDGAGCVILSQADTPGVVASLMGSDNKSVEILGIKPNLKLHMNGKEVFKMAVEQLSANALAILSQNSLTIDQVDWIVPHQANIRIISAVAERINCPMEKFAVTADIHANTSAASIPLAFDRYLKEGKIKKGQTILFTAIGAGMTWGSVLVKY